MQQEDIFTPMFVFEIQWCHFFQLSATAVLDVSQHWVKMRNTK